MSELENDGYGPNSAIADLVDRLNAATAPGTYAFIDADAGTSQINVLGTDAIKVGLIYKPAKVTPVGNIAALNTGAFGEIITQTVPPEPPSSGVTQRNRPPLAATFEQLLTGERITVVANHLKSKGSGCADNFSPLPPDPDLGDGAGNCNLTRKIAAQEMAAWLADQPDRHRHAQRVDHRRPELVRQGGSDHGAYERGLRQPDRAAPRPERVLVTCSTAQSGYLDHALASPALAARVTGVAEWHVNADEPSVLDYNLNFKSAGQQVSLFAPDAFRSSDHDPLVVGINFNTPPAITALETYDTGLGELGAEIISIRGDRGLLSNAGDGSIDILDLSDPLDVKRIQRVKVPELAGLNSVAIHPTKDLFLAVAGTSKPAAAPVPGKVLAFRLSDGALIGIADVGIQPDSIAISPDGNTAVVANEAEGFARNDNGGPGSLSLIALAAFDPAAPTPLVVTQIALPSQNGVPGFSVNRTDDLARLPIDNAPGSLEPETVAFSADSGFAYVSLQENSGAVRVNLSDNSLIFFGLGQAAHLADLTISVIGTSVVTSSSPSTIRIVSSCVAATSANSTPVPQLDGRVAPGDRLAARAAAAAQHEPAEDRHVVVPA